MSKIEIDFETLKFNLYEILNVRPDAEENKIRKAFIKLIKRFHPDKNSKLEEDIYYHIILSNQILLNKELRLKYDTYLELRIDNFNELKTSFNKTNNKVEGKANNNEFKTKVMELDKIHGYNTDDLQIPTIDKYNKAKENRNNDNVIEKENIKNIDEFNTKFTDYKLNGKLKNQIVEYDKNTEISTFQNDNFVNLNHIDKLYIDGPVVSNNYCSLDKAFTLQCIPTHNKTNTDAMIADYKNDTKLLSRASRYEKIKLDY